MMIEAKLLRDLWPWVIGGAANIANRSSTAVLWWKTPYEKLSGKKPDLSAFRTIGCVAYTRQEQQKSDKMVPRAYEGILLGCVASNIWHIWNSRKQCVEEARDVQFDETRMYDPKQPFQARKESSVKRKEPDDIREIEAPKNEEKPQELSKASHNEDVEISSMQENERLIETAAQEYDHCGQLTARPTPESTPKPHILN